ncbi:MAG: FAD-dependent oxidoreductase [Oligoflexia bacterium]|nr:FAD-dependent oxidoreductase [Oligoflexia bacterium]
MARQEKKSTLTEIKDITPTVKEMVFKPHDGEGLTFKAGQFIMLSIPHQGKMVQRAYSVASADTVKDHFRLVIKHYELGVASNWVRTLKGGEEISYTGPFGKFLLKTPPQGQVVFVCTSTGLAPLYSMLASQGHLYKETDFKVFMGIWNEKEIFYEKELNALKKNLPKLEINFVLDSAPAGWKGMSGRVTEHIEKLDLKRPTEFYICGNPAMIKAVKEMLLSKNFPADKIYTESYG